MLRTGERRATKEDMEATGKRKRWAKGSRESLEAAVEVSLFEEKSEMV